MTINSSDRNLIEAYLRQRFRKRERGFLARLCGEAEEYSYDIAQVEEHCASREITQSSILWVAVKEAYLDRSRLPIAESWGLFALSQSECLHLNHKNPDAFTKVLQRERHLANVSASSLSVLFSDSMLSEKSRWHTVIDELSLTYQFESWGYVIDSEKRDKFLEIYSPPTKTSTGGTTTVEFFSLVGSALSNHSLTRTVLTISSDGKFRFETLVSFNNFFTHVPYRRIKGRHTAVSEYSSFLR